MKKRMVSLIVALCMMISLFPVSVFADEGVKVCATPIPADTPDGALVLDSDGVPILSIGVGNLRPGITETTGCYRGDFWYYDVPQGKTTGTLCFLGDYDLSLQPFSSTISEDITVVLQNGAHLKNALVKGELIVNDGCTVDNVSCEGTVTNSGTINGGSFNDSVKNDGVIKDGTFNGTVDNNGTIHGGTFKDTVDNNGTIDGGTFKDTVKNDGTINDGTFNGNVDNKGDVTGGDFNGSVDNHPGSTFEPDSDVNKTYTVTIEGGTINGKTTVKAKKGTELTAVLDTNAIPDGMAFDMWSLSSNALTCDPSVDLKAGNMTFLMPAEDVTIRAQYISSAIAEDSPGLSPLGTAALITAGAAVTGVAVWQGYKIGVELYLERELPLGTPIPTNRRELVLLLWNTAGKPEPASAELFSDIDAQDLDLQKASHWAQEHQLLGVSNEYNLTLFEPESAVNETDVLLGWLRTKKLLRNVETS